MPRKKGAQSVGPGAGPSGTSGSGTASGSGGGGMVAGLTQSANEFRSNELYRQEQEQQQHHQHAGGPDRPSGFAELDGSAGQPWYMSNFFLLRPPTLFGAWDGVFSSCVIHLFGVIVFLRTGWMVGNAGVVLSIGIVGTAVLICSVAALAGIFISQRCAHLEGRGTIHFLLSHVLGTQVGGAISLAYTAGQAVSCALHAMGFAESVVGYFNVLHPLAQDDPRLVWVERGLAAAMILSLLIINVAGVKWVVRLQTLLLGILGAALADFSLGVFTRSDPDHGVRGLSVETFESNLQPHWESKRVNIFTVFGIFFPAVTGVMAGINMSGDLAAPDRDIPRGTFCAVVVSLGIYLIFILGLGGTCNHHYLLHDMMLPEKVSFWGVALLAGLYTSSVSHCLGSLYTGPRLLQNMASENVVPAISPMLSYGRGPNKVPTRALMLFSAVTLGFIAIGRLNALAPVVTIIYLFTYASLEYAYFSLAMTFDIQRERDVRYLAAALSTSSSVDQLKTDYGTAKLSPGGDLDRLFPERRGVNGNAAGPQQQDGGDQSPQYSSTLTSPNSAIAPGPVPGQQGDLSSIESTQTGNTSPCDRSDSILPEIREKPAVWWRHCENRWIAIVAAILKMSIMFCVNWSYALSLLLLVGFVHFYIGQVSPGAFPGISEFKLILWLKSLIYRAVGKETREYEHIVVTPARPNMEVQSAMISEEGRDYSSRDKYHQSVTKEMADKRPKISHESD